MFYALRFCAVKENIPVKCKLIATVIGARCCLRPLDGLQPGSGDLAVVMAPARVGVHSTHCADEELPVVLRGVCHRNAELSLV